MKRPKTVKEYVAILRMLEKLPLTTLAGWHELPKAQKDALRQIDGQICNQVNEIPE